MMSGHEAALIGVISAPILFWRHSCRTPLASPPRYGLDIGRLPCDCLDGGVHIGRKRGGDEGFFTRGQGLACGQAAAAHYAAAHFIGSFR